MSLFILGIKAYWCASRVGTARQLYMSWYGIFLLNYSYQYQHFTTLVIDHV